MLTGGGGNFKVCKKFAQRSAKWHIFAAGLQVTIWKVSAVLTEELKVYKDMYDLVVLIMQAREHFAKMYKHDFGGQLVMTAVNCCQFIRRANMSKDERFHFLEEFQMSFGDLTLLLRVCRDMKIYPLKTDAAITAKVAEIGKQVTAWKNASRKPES